MNRLTNLKIVASVSAASAPFVVTGLAFAAEADGVGQINNFLTNIIRILSGIIFLVAVVYIVIGGFQYTTSSGNPEHLDKGKRTISYAALGLVITTAAYSFANVISTAAQKAFGN